MAPKANSVATSLDARLRRDLRTLARFIEVYCRARHPGATRHAVNLRTHDIPALHGRALELCPDCTKLLTHAFMKRTLCPLDPKPSCKKCPDHCYAPHYRAQIREVMKVAGRRLVLSGRLHYLLKLWF